MNRILALTLTITAATPAVAQDCARGEIKLSTQATDFNGYEVAAPKEALPPIQNCPGTVHTAKLAHAVWVREDAAGDPGAIMYSRSTDGGFSWSAPVAIWQTTAAGDGFNDNYEMVAEGHNVAVVLGSTRSSTGGVNAGDACWVVGSCKQGLPGTWQTILATNGIEAPLSTGDQLNDMDDPNAAIAGDKVHVCYEADYTNAVGVGGSATSEHVYYQRVEWDQNGNLVLGLPEEVAMESTPTGTTDADVPDICADGRKVAVVWLDDRTGTNNTFSRVSNDCGANFGAEHAHTNFMVGSGVDAPDCCIDGNNVYVTQVDARNGSDDDVFISISRDCGANWRDGILASLEPAGADVDGHRVVCENGKIYVFYTDDRNGLGDVLDNPFVVVDRNGGNDFAAGTQQESQLSTGDTGLHNADCTADGEIAVVALEDGAFPEPFSLAYTYDCGRTWESCTLQPGGGNGRDTDEPDTAVTINRDLIGVWGDDGNVNNEAFVNSLRTPTLRYDPMLGPFGQFKYECGSPSDVGDVVIFFPSLAAPTSMGAAVRPKIGIEPNFTPDALTASALPLLPLFIARVDGTGTACLDFPNFAPLIGQPIYWIAITVDPMTRVPTRAYTDAIQQM